MTLYMTSETSKLKEGKIPLYQKADLNACNNGNSVKPYSPINLLWDFKVKIETGESNTARYLVQRPYSSANILFWTGTLLSDPEKITGEMTPAKDSESEYSVYSFHTH